MTQRSLGTRLMAIPLAGLIAASVLGQGTILIDTSSRNGSFEEGITAPWFGDVTTFQNPGFASHGAWYAELQSAGLAVCTQNLLANPNAGLGFLLTFDARNGTQGFDLMSPQISARSIGGFPLSSTVTPLVTPPLVSSQWANNQFRLDIPEAWDGSGFIFTIVFRQNSPIAGSTYTAYIDNIVLQQIPEPSSLTILVCGVVLLNAWLLRRGRNR